MKDVLKVLGYRLRETRQARNLSQENLAVLSGIHRTYVSSVECGRRNISILTLTRSAHALGVTTASLLTPHTCVKSPKKSGNG